MYQKLITNLPVFRCWYSIFKFRYLIRNYLFSFFIWINKYGGTNTKVFDCSGFVQFTYKKVLNIGLPRTTWLMLKEGKGIKKTQLQIGDLVLFRTSKRYRHVGIFMGENQFMHVSTKKGLMKSNLDNPYWLKHYLTSRRIF